MKPWFLSTLILVLLTNPTTLIGNSKSNQNPLSYSVEVGLAQIFVRVTDEKNQWVTGLKESNFEVLEDGVRQKILYCDEILPQVEENRSASPVDQGMAAAPPAQEPFSSRRTSNVLIFVFDQVSSSQSGLAKQKKYIQNFLKDFQTPNTLVSLVVIKNSGSFEVVEDLTSERDKLMNALERIKGGTAGIEDRIAKTTRIADPTEMEYCVGQAGLGAIATECHERAMTSIMNKANAYAIEEQNRSIHVIRSLEKLLLQLEHVQGHKSLILVSEGLDPSGAYYLNYAAGIMDYWVFRYDLSGPRRQKIDQSKSQAAQLSARANVVPNLARIASAADITMFWVNPEYGKHEGGISADSAHPGGFHFKYFNAPDMESAMRGIAEDTGGTALTSTDMTKFYKQLTETLPKYYAISYKPNRPMNDGKYHHVAVRIPGSKYKIAYKKELKDISPGERLTNKIAELIDYPDSADFPLLSEVNYFLKSEQEYRLVIRTGVPYDQLEPVIEEKNVKDDVHFSFVVRDANGNVFLNKDQVVPFRSDLEKFEILKANKAALEYLENCNLKPGRYTVAVVVVDSAGSKTASSHMNVELPARTEKCLSLSPVLLASNANKSSTTANIPTTNAKGEIQYGDQIYQFALARSFPSWGSLTGFYQIYNANLPSILLSFKLYRENEFINQTSEKEITAYTDPNLKVIFNFFSVPYKNLAPGSYELEVVVREANNPCSTSSRVAFQVAGDQAF